MSKSRIPFHDGATQTSIPPSDQFLLRRYDSLPLSSSPKPIDTVPYWILHHLETPSDAKEFYSPVYAFTLSTVSYLDFGVYNHYNSTSPSAVFRNFFVCTRLDAEGGRKTLYWKEGMVDEEDGTRRAKLQYSPPKGGKGEKREEWVEMRVGAVRRALEEHFGMRFPQEWSGN